MNGNDKIKNFRDKLKKVQELNEKIVVMSNETGIDTTQVLYIDYVGEHWAKGHCLVHTRNGIQEVPETINYVDIFNTKVGNGFEVIFPDSIQKGGYDHATKRGR